MLTHVFPIPIYVLPRWHRYTYLMLSDVPLKVLVLSHERVAFVVVFITSHLDVNSPEERVQVAE